MTIDAGRLGRTEAVIVRADAPPELPVECVLDVQPGAGASFDGDRHRLPLSVSRGTERRVASAGTAREVGGAVDAMLPERRPAAVRFGDRQVVRRLLPAAKADALERALVATAEGAEAALLTWTTGEIGRGDRRRYGVVLERAAPRSD